MMEYADYLKRAEEEIDEPPGPRREALVSMRATANHISDNYARLIDNTKSCVECKMMGFYCETCNARLSLVRYRMHEAQWELTILEHPPPSDDAAEYREWLETNRHAWIVIENRWSVPHGTPRDILNSYPVQWIDIELLTLDLDQRANPAAPNLERIGWIDNAALLAYLLHKLTAEGYITPPQRNGAPNWAAFARTIFAAFELKKENGDPVTLESFIQAMRPTGDVTENKRGPHCFKIYKRE